MAGDVALKERRKRRAKKTKKTAVSRKTRKKRPAKRKVARSSRKRRASKRAQPARTALSVRVSPTPTIGQAAAFQPTRMILLPPRGLRADSSALSFTTQGFMTSLHTAAQAAQLGKRAAARTVLGANVPQLKNIAPDLKMQVIDSIAENGAKLVSIAPADLARIRTAQPGLRFAPVLEYELPLGPRARQIQVLAGPSVKVAGVRFTLVSASGHAVAGARVVAFTDFASQTGAEANSDRSGSVELALPASTRSIERLYIYPKLGFWPMLLKSVKVSSLKQVSLGPIVLPPTDFLRVAYGNDASDTDGDGVVVAVVDTGCGPHPDLTIAGGYSAVGNDPNDYADNGEQHGTHVAGIIAAHGDAATGVRGVAPGTTLRSYRVFAKPGEKTTNFDIAKAVDRARQDGCDLINMSLKQTAGQVADDALRAAIEDARNAGMLPIAAAGNDHRGPVAFPASDDLCIAVAAMGRIGTFPPDSTSADAIAPPPSTIDPKEFVAAFSNYGPDIDLIAPGVGIISAVPTKGFAVMDGTSMACPAVTGICARLLSAYAAIIKMKRDANRSEEMARLLLGAAKSRGFPAEYQGQGMPEI